MPKIKCLIFKENLLNRLSKGRINVKKIDEL